MTKKPIRLTKLIRRTIFYLFIVTLAVSIMLPVFFLVSLSFLSNREAYNFPLPLVPSLSAEYSLTHGERGYLLSVYDNFEKEYQNRYDILLLPGAVTDFFGIINDSLNVRFNTKKPLTIP